MIYQYECENGHFVEVTQSIHDEALTKCPTCQGKTERVITGGLGFMGDPKTIGSLAERNVSKMGYYERDAHFEPEKRKAQEKKDRAPWWRKGTTGPNKDLNKLTDAQKEKYIMEGK